jgi:hypothetical protein
VAPTPEEQPVERPQRSALEVWVDVLREQVKEAKDSVEQLRQECNTRCEKNQDAWEDRCRECKEEIKKFRTFRTEVRSSIRAWAIVAGLIATLAGIITPFIIHAMTQ